MQNTTIDFGGFLKKVKTLEGDEFSRFVHQFCVGLLQVQSNQQQLQDYMKGNGSNSAKKLLLYIHADKHESSCLDKQQRTEIAKVTVLILSVRATLDDVSNAELQDNFDELVKTAKKFDVFSKDADEYKTLEEIENYCFVTLYNKGAKMSKDWRDALVQVYANLFVYITNYCQCQNIIWLNDNISKFKTHIKYLECYYQDNAQLKKVFDAFQKIDTPKPAPKSDVKMLTDSKKTPALTKNAPRHLMTGLSTGLSVGLFALAATTAWPALVCYAVARVVLAGTKIVAHEMHDRAREEDKKLHFTSMLQMIKHQFHEVREGVLQLENNEHLRVTTIKRIKKIDLLITENLQIEYHEMRQQPQRTPSEKVLMLEIDKQIPASTNLPRLMFDSCRQQPVGFVNTSSVNDGDSLQAMITNDGLTEEEATMLREIERGFVH